MENKEEIDLFSIIAFGSLAMLSLVSFIIVFIVLYQKRMLAHKTLLQENENNYQRQLLNTSVEVAEQERQKIATNIHDDVGLFLNIIKLNLSRISENLNDIKIAEELLKNNSGLIEETISSLRAISQDLMPTVLVKLGLIQGINEMCLQIKAACPTEIILSTNANEINLSKKDELQLYRLIKEILNNVIKHAAATSIKINITYLNNTLYTDITHNGEGITMKTVNELAGSTKGIGLKSILSRTQLTGSVLDYVIVSANESKISINTPVYGNAENKA